MKSFFILGAFRAAVFALALAGLMLGQQATAPAPTDYEAMGRAVIANLSARHFENVSSQFSEAVSAALPGDRLATAWDGLRSRFGEFQSVESTRHEDKDGLHIVHVISVFERQKIDMTVIYDAQTHIGTLNFRPVQPPWEPPAYSQSDAFHEREVTVGGAPWQLPGTLTLPNRAGPFPAIVLVHGSGPNGRDEAFGPNKMFKDLAWGLATRGVAVLRYDKRTLIYGKQMVELNNLTVKEEVVDDARAAVDLLASLPEIQARRIFVAGHSLGGYLGPRIVSGDSKIAGLILLAGSTRPMEEAVVDQVHYLAGLRGAASPETQALIDKAEKAAAQIHSPELKSGMTVDFLGSLIPASYFLDLREYHPGEIAATLHIPILVLQGERDYQVGMTDLEGWKKALAGHPSAGFMTYPALNHYFMPGSGPSSDAEYMKPNHVQEDVVRDIAAWVKSKSDPAATRP